MPHATLQSAATATFEELALLLAAPDAHDVDDGPAAPLAGGVRVAFRGPVCGAVTVHVTAELLGAVATNMLGRRVSTDDPLCRDALGELANVLCGTLLPSLAGRRAEFVLAPPAWLPIGHAGASPTAGAAHTASLTLETGRALVALHLADDAPLAGVGGTA